MKRFLIIFGLASALVLFVKAEGITFPVLELGNCASKEECRAYCDEAGNMEACIKFAESHGLMNKTEAETAQKFKQKLSADGGPGGCGSPKECRSFCNITANLEVCLEFAKKQGINDGYFEEAEKILKFVKSGGEMPGGCNSKENCEEYCKDFSRAEECVAFGKKAGIVRTAAKEGSELSDELILEKFIESVNNSYTPGGCKNKKECEDYCSGNTKRAVCLEFAEKTGILSKLEADKIKNSGNIGPGGCTSAVSCKMYCDYPGHREECVKFAEEHGYMTKVELKQANDGLVSVRSGLERVPVEVHECLKSTVGENILNDVQSGNMVPGPAIGNQVKSCFEKFGQKVNQTEFLKNVPSAIAVCVQEKLGIKIETLKSETAKITPEMADTVRVCFQRNEIQKNVEPRPVIGKPISPPTYIPNASLINFLKTAPPEVAHCLKEALGENFDRIISGENIPIDTSKIKICLDKFRPFAPVANPAQVRPSEIPKPPVMPTGFVPAINLSQFPPEIIACIKAKIGNDTANFIAQPDAVIKFEILVKECADSLSESTPLPETKPLPTPIPLLTPTPSIIISPPPATGIINDTMCIQVITPAKDPVTGACKLFATPCNVPANWVRVERCESIINSILPTSFVPMSSSLAQVFQPFMFLIESMFK